MIANEESAKYFRKIYLYPVEAVRLTLENMEKIADFLGGEYSYLPVFGSKATIRCPGDIGWAGDWLLKIGDRFEFIGHEEFLAGYLPAEKT